MKCPEYRMRKQGLGRAGLIICLGNRVDALRTGPGILNRQTGIWLPVQAMRMGYTGIRLRPQG